MKVKNILYKMGILSILDIMCKSFTVILVFLFFSVFAFAQTDNTVDNSSEESADTMAESLEDPDYLVLPLPKDSFLTEGPPIDEVIEAVGTIVYASVAVYTSPDKDSKLLRNAYPGEKVIIKSTWKDWYSVRMYTGKEGFIEKRYVKATKVFYDESVSTNNMDKRVLIELNSLVERFNYTLKNSIYLEKFKAVPKLEIVSAKKSGQTVNLSLLYSVVDQNGFVIPSRKKNMLDNEMKELVEIIFLKLLEAKATKFNINIYKPVFSQTGTVVNNGGSYAELTLLGEDVDPAKLKNGEQSLLKLVKSTIPTSELFAEFPY